MEIENLERLMSLLTFVHLSSSAANSRAWFLSFLDLFSVKSFLFFFYYIIQFIKTNPVLSNQIFIEIKSPFKGQGLCLASDTQEGKHLQHATI